MKPTKLGDGQRVATAKRERFDLRDAHIYGGMVILSIGLWMVTPAAGLIGAGIVLLYFGLWRF